MVRSIGILLFYCCKRCPLFWFAAIASQRPWDGSRIENGKVGFDYSEEKDGRGCIGFVPPALLDR